MFSQALVCPLDAGKPLGFPACITGHMTRRSAIREVGGPHPGKDGLHPGGLHLEVCVLGGLHQGVGGVCVHGGWTDSPPKIYGIL